MAHEKYMQIALNLARQGLGRTGSNPAVGCVIVRDEQILAATRTADSGRPHAEFLALENIDASNANVYVTLEPCAHEGTTPACSRLLVEAGVKTVIIATRDPDIRTAGHGIKILEEAGIEIIEGICEEEAREINIGFFKRLEDRKPFVALKAATDINNKYLPATDGKPSWVTGALSRKYVHMLRSQFDVIITGTGTILADNPNLNVRLPGMKDESPIKIILGQSEVPETFNIYQGKDAMQLNGDLKSILSNLAQAGTNRVFIEAGPTLSNTFLKENLVDEIYWFKSNSQVEGQKFFDEELLQDFTQTSERKFGDDILIKLNK